MSKIDTQRPKPEYPLYQSKRFRTFTERSRFQWEDGDGDSFVSYWYPMYSQSTGYDDDPDYREDTSSW